MFVCHTYEYKNDGHDLVEEAAPGTSILEYSDPQGDGWDGQEAAKEQRYTEGQIVLVVHF